MISVPPLESIPHRPENSMYSSSYMRSGRTLKLAAAPEDETSSSALHHHPSHHHHPAGIVNEYHPRGTVSSNIYTSQHDTHHVSSGHHQYEVRPPPNCIDATDKFRFQHLSSSSSGGHVLSPSRRWSLPETMGGPFRSSGSTM